MSFIKSVFRAVALCGCIGSCIAGEPRINRVEPPSWWTGHSLNPVRVMLTGRDLAGAEVSSDRGLVISNVSVAASGSYAFCDAYIAPGLSPGVRKLRVRCVSGETTADFNILPPPARTGAFAGFTQDDVIYLIMTDRFANGEVINDNPAASPGLLDRSKPRDYHGGDFRGIKDRLPYLQELGVTAIWLTPWYDNVNHANAKEKYTRENHRSPDGLASTDYHGYGAVDFYGVEERFGSMESLVELVRAAQAEGLKVIQDQVANHTGPYHPWVKDPPTASWFNGTETDHLDNSWQTWTLAERNPPPGKLKSTLEGWFINILPDLNQNDPATATYLIQNSLWWIGMTGVDAIRQDTLPYVPRSYWSRWTGALKREFPDVTILGEVLDSRPELVGFFQGGVKRFDGVDSGVDTLFDFPLHYGIRDVFAQRRPMTRLAEVLAADAHYVNPGVLVTLLGLHDTTRFMGESGATAEGLRMAFTFLLTARGTPLIYYGDEIGMSGGGDPDNRRDFPGGWPEDTRNAFLASGRTQGESAVYNHVRQLLRLRRELEPLRRGEMRVLNAAESTFAFSRTTKSSGVVVAFNNSDSAREVAFALPNPIAASSELHNHLSEGTSIPVQNGKVSLLLPPRSAVILAPKPAAVAAE